jgi:hypothetical protein
VAHVFHRIDSDWVLEHALYLAPVEDLERAVALARGVVVGQGLAGTAGVAALNRRIAEWVARAVEHPTAVPATRAARELRHLARLLAGERRFLEDPQAFVAGLDGLSPLASLGGDDGRLRDPYLRSSDGSVLFVVVSPASPDDSLPALRSLVGALRERAASVQARVPGFRVALTGPPAMTVEEMEAVRRDSWVSSVLTGVGVAGLVFLVFRWKSHALLVLAALAVGLVWALGAVRLELGYLNTLTSAFIPTLIGVGVAYGIHPISEYELEGAHTVDPLAAARGAYHVTGPAVTVAAVTTAAAFFSIMLMQFPGFAELGLVAGFGVLLCLVASLVTLPALTVVHGRWRARRGREPRCSSSAAAVDRLWVERAAGRVCRFPRMVTLAGLVLTGVAGWAAAGVRFNTDILDLLPAGAESLRYMRRMTEGSDLSPVFNVVVAEHQEELRAFHERAVREPAIERFDSILQLLPEQPERSRRAVGELAALLERVELPAVTAPPDPNDLARSIEILEARLGQAAEVAFAAGLGELVGPLEQGRAEAEAVRRVVLEAPAERIEAWAAGQQFLVGWFRTLLGELRRAAAADPPTLERLPKELRERFVTTTGRLVGYLYPVGSVFRPAELAAYVEASRRVSPEAAGYPLMFFLMSQRITSGFHRAVVVGSALVLLILLVDYRNLRDAALAAAPLAIGIVWMLGSMRLLGIDFNFANLVGVPLVIGVGIDNGVHVIHRVRLEGSRGMDIVLRHTGRAIMISSLTTMIGFGSLALASHRGLSSLGLVLLLGVSSCLLAATIVLPNLLVGFGFVRR